jgi:hypothetical protein
VGDLADHGGKHRAVFVYQDRLLPVLAAQLGRGDFPYGRFGENFTVAGLADDRSVHRHRYRIGEAAQLPQCGPPVVARVVTGASACDVLHSLPRWDDTPFGSAYSSVRCLTLGR